MKWADLCIKRVRYSPDRKRIVSVIAAEDNGDMLINTREFSRIEIVELLQTGKRVITVPRMEDNARKFRRGRKVDCYLRRGDWYIKSVADDDERDNLDELPEYQ